MPCKPHRPSSKSSRRPGFALFVVCVPRYLNSARLASSSCEGTLEEVRGWLYFVLGLSELFDGGGYTKDPTGKRGYAEYLMRRSSRLELRAREVCVDRVAAAQPNTVDDSGSVSFTSWVCERNSSVLLQGGGGLDRPPGRSPMGVKIPLCSRQYRKVVRCCFCVTFGRWRCW